MNVAICDDSIEDAETLAELIRDAARPEKPHIEFYSGGEELLPYCGYGEDSYDVIFLDMEMGDINGIETANKIREINKHVLIVFVTSHTQYMRQSFECEPFRFLVKPVEIDEVQKVYNAICKKLDQERTTVVFSVGRDTMRLYSEDIIYFEKRHHQIVVHTETESYKTRRTMLDLYDSIDRQTFCIPHKSYIVNMNYIKRIGDNSVELHDSDAIIPISRGSRKPLIQAVMEFKERKIII